MGPSISIRKSLSFQTKCDSRIFPLHKSLSPTIISLLLTLDDPLENAARKRFGLEERRGRYQVLEG